MVLIQILTNATETSSIQPYAKGNLSPTHSKLICNSLINMCLEVS